MTRWFYPTSVLGSEHRNLFQGRRSDRHRLNVPGPFHGGESDTCLTGRFAAPGAGCSGWSGRPYRPDHPDR